MGLICQGQLPMMVEKCEGVWMRFVLALDSENVVASAAQFSPNGRFFFVGTNKVGDGMM